MNYTHLVYHRFLLLKWMSPLEKYAHRILCGMKIKFFGFIVIMANNLSTSKNMMMMMMMTTAAAIMFALIP